MKDGINNEETSEYDKRRIAYYDSIEPGYQGVGYKMYYDSPKKRVNITLEDISKDEPDMVNALLEDIEDSEFLDTKE